MGIDIDTDYGGILEWIEMNFEEMTWKLMTPSIQVDIAWWNELKSRKISLPCVEAVMIRKPQTGTEIMLSLFSGHEGMELACVQEDFT